MRGTRPKGETCNTCHHLMRIETTAGHSQAHAQTILDRYLARPQTLAESAIANLDEHRQNRKRQTACKTAGAQQAEPASGH
jgi:hypothetical protein